MNNTPVHVNIALERNLSRPLAAAYILGEQVRYPNGQPANFGELARDLVTHLGGITNLQLAPGGFIDRIYPLAGHESAPGHSILRDDRRKQEALEAIESADITIAGPLQLLQGGVGLVGRYPVFLQDQDQNAGNFRGFASALIMIDDLIASTRLAALRHQGYQYRLWLQNPEAGEGNIYQFAGETMSPAASPTI